MDNQEVLTPEEIAAEQAAISVPKDEEIRSKIVEEFGFDETTDTERIDKLVAKDKEQREKLSKAIQQKIKHRTDADTLRKGSEKKPDLKEEKGKEEKDLSSMDTIAIINAKVPQEDIKDVIEYAKFKNTSIEEALKSDILQTTLAKKAEYRRTADASNVGSKKTTTTGTDSATLLKDLSEGKVPEKGSKEAEDLFWARHGGRRK